MSLALLASLLYPWPRHATEPPPRPCWYWVGPAMPMPPAPALHYWSNWPDGLVYRLFRRGDP